MALPTVFAYVTIDAEQPKPMGFTDKDFSDGPGEMKEFQNRMTAWDRFKGNLTKLRDGKPGSRFVEYAAEQKPQGVAARSSNYVLGLGLVIVGLGIGWLPGPGGFLGFVGLAILSKELPFIARWLDKIEVFLRATIASWTQPRRG